MLLGDGNESYMKEHLKVVLEDGFANGWKGATVHGMEMNHLSCQMARVMEWK